MVHLVERRNDTDLWIRSSAKPREVSRQIHLSYAECGRPSEIINLVDSWISHRRISVDLKGNVVVSREEKRRDVSVARTIGVGQIEMPASESNGLR